MKTLIIPRLYKFLKIPLIKAESPSMLLSLLQNEATTLFVIGIL